ncbi:MAG: adenylyl-sulfate kinase [Desulfovibrionaceae bacterium]|nr:adenylyl-sulfate kinase [Desulfovibrionaceae bacterium]
MTNPDAHVVWITGLSGAGKTTLAKALLPKLSNAILLDGDEMREALIDVAHGFDAESRKRFGFTYARWARLIALQGYTVVVATISLYHDLHAWNRENLPNYLEVFLDVPEEIRRKRDPKQLYKNQTKQMAGADTLIMEPLAPHITLTYPYDLETAVADILLKLKTSQSLSK